jgi:DNA-directed RNA polymerase subunit beta'
VLRNSDGNLITMGRNVASIVLEDEQGTSVPCSASPTARKPVVDDGDKVKRGQRLAEWDPYTRPIMTEVEGTSEFEDVVDGVSVSEVTDEATGITKRQLSSTGVRPRAVPDLQAGDRDQGQEGRDRQAARGGEARFLLSVDAILSVEPGAKVKPGDVLARIPLESAKTKDITGGLPRVAELFEARRPKDHAIIAEIDGTIRFGRDYKNKRRIQIEPAEDE